MGLHAKSNILIDETGRPHVADFGLLTIVSDPANLLSSTSRTQGGAVRWMSPELINPEAFGLDKSRPTKSSDCYAFGMVVYETIGGRLPFHEHLTMAVYVRVAKGERPSRGGKFRDSLWNVMERCWASQPSDRPSIEDVLQCLQVTVPPSMLNGEMGTYGDDLDLSDGSLDIQNGTNGTTITERSTSTSSDLTSVDYRGLGPISSTSWPPAFKVTGKADAESLGPVDPNSTTTTSASEKGLFSSQPLLVLYGALIAPNCDVVAYRRLIGRTFDRLRDLPSLIEAIVSSEDKGETISRLSVVDAQTLIDVMDEVCSRFTCHCRLVDDAYTTR